MEAIFELKSMVDYEERNGNGLVLAHTPDQCHEQQQAPPEEVDQGAGTGADEAELLWKLRKYLVLLAILAAAITYQAGLAPPGGFWQDNNHGHVASDIVLRSSYPQRYLVFFYCNTTAFVASLMVLILLLVRKLSRNAVWLRSLQLAMILCLLGLMGAYAAGSCREVRTSVYVWALLLGIFSYVALHVVFFLHFAPRWLRKVFSGIHKQWKRLFGIVEVTDQTEELERNRSSLLVLAILAATVTYAAGLSPPGGFWSDEDGNHIAGDPVLRDHYPRRFKAFLICNATAFAGSLVIIIMLLSETTVSHVVRSNALRLCVLVSLFGLMGAYAAGSCREVHTSIYVFALVGAVLLYLVVQFIVPFVPKPLCVENIINSVKEKKKLNAFIMTLLEPEPEHGSSNNNDMSSTSDDGVKHDLQKLHTYLLWLGILAATVAYQAGLNPPGGFWTDNSDGHTAGDPILKLVSPERYKAFFYCNATAFFASLVVIILLQSQLITMHAMKRYVLQTAMALVLFGVMGAYAAGSSRKFSTSIYVSVLVLLVFAYVVLHALLYVALKTRLKSTIEKIDDSTSKFLHRFTASSSETVDDVVDLQKRRMFLMLLAILAASVTYQAGISPPGGFWTDNSNGHRAGDPVFRDMFRHRYRVFFYFNATAFMASLAVILLLVSKRLCERGLKCYALCACVLVDLISLMGAFAAGSCRKRSTSVYVILVVVAVLVYVVIQVLVLAFAKEKVDHFLEQISKSFMRQGPSVNQSNNIIQVITSVNQSNNSIEVIREKSRECKWRKDLMLIGTLAITVTYQAGLVPPGGAWPDDRDNHFAGDPILRDTNRTRYRVFFYCNATAFMASMVMVILLLNNTISKYKRSLLAMKTTMVLNLLGLLGAYAAGSCRKSKTSAYIFALVIAVFIYIVIHVLLSFDKVAMLVKEKWTKWMTCLKMLLLIGMDSDKVAMLVKEKGKICMPFLKTSAPVGTDSNSQPSVGEPGQVPLAV